ncbi:ATP-dependent 6-phosphofructokinase [Nostoc sp. FACHB-152]|uniref:ATP-dependent 6-phosphofructokinase n=1 Tax=unclassified Nostoc TaxID=2593658 RepID=UPI0016837C73|nr:MULTISPECIES: ATP-dependent 6-phosphofructokinase [unclassified Nostoc]MBD2445749.1 ATP-dependent 6-phosphofructokinase [Nostoc sp. FACHB-152]MBD2466863.1 ATP-dependent 6-phosphofructokinase [Nostoc sp. FACHB-145]
MQKHNRIGILTSGGDCPGLNTVIRSVVSHATLTYGWEVLGIPYATQGLLERKASHLNMHGLDVHGIDPLLSMGGTILGTINRGDTLTHADELNAGYQALELDALIAIGGDGSLNILHQLACQGNWNLVGIPKTIDNDVALTERAIGFDTAVNTITDALNRLTYTAASHDRVMIVEVMGRKAGHLALHSGIAGGADCILIPEIPYSIEAVYQQINELRDRWGRKFAIVVVAEGIKPTQTSSCNNGAGQQPICGMGQYIADQLALYPTNWDIRVSVLGHIQRGGIPSALDRLTATAFGKAAVDLIAQQNYGQMVAWQNGQVVNVPLEAVLQQSPIGVDPHGYLVETARSIGTYIGDFTAIPNRREEFVEALIH